MRIAVLGVGLIGGSIGLAARNRLDAEVSGFDPDASLLAKAEELGAIDTAAGSIAEASAGSCATGAAQKTTSAPSTAPGTESHLSLIAPSSRARSSSSGSGSNPATSASSLRRAASPIEPPIRPTPSTAILIGPGQPAWRRSRTAAESRSRASTVVSQSMQASVIDWP